MSSSSDQTSIASHYAATTAAILFGATIIGAARVRDPERISLVVLPAVLVTGLLSPFWTAVPVARDVIMGSPLVRASATPSV